jgi:plastocyanin
MHHAMAGNFPAKTGRGLAGSFFVLMLFLFFDAAAGQGDLQQIEIKLGDHRFTPAEIRLVAGQPAALTLVNTDGMTPHNFKLEFSGDRADIDVDVSAGDSVEVRLDPLPAGTYTFYCDKKLPFMKSHRAKGMEGSLIVTAE